MESADWKEKVNNAYTWVPIEYAWCGLAVVVVGGGLKMRVEAGYGLMCS
jgi:hypothetical protein